MPLPTTPASLLPLVLQSMASTSSPRLRELMNGLVAHLHAFALETRLTEEEFEQALAFLVAVGQATGEKKNEVVLLADLLGMSSLVALANNVQAHGESDAALLGPFWRARAPMLPAGACIAAPGTPGVPLEATGRVLDTRGRALEGATVDVWQAAPNGLYENQDPSQPDMNLRGRFTTDAQGRFCFRSVRPAGYPVPTDGPCGDLLRAQQRHPFRPAHLHFMVSKPGFKVLVTQVFADDAEHLESDPVFGVTQHLVGHFERTERDGQPLALLHHEFTLLEGEMRLPHAPIP